MEFAIPLAGFALGLAVGRWWVVAAAAPFGAYIALTNPLPEELGTYVATMLTLLLAFAITAGVGLRRLRRRRAL